MAASEQTTGTAPQHAIVFDTAYWPLLMVRFDGAADDAQFAEYLDRLTVVLEQRERYAVVLDATRASITPISQGRMQGEWLRRHRVEVAQLCAGAAFVVPSRLFRMVMNSIFMVQPMPAPNHVCSTVEEGIAWAAAQLGVEVPGTLLQWSDEETTQPGRR